ncbi:hypothetical protein P7C73_g5318, partial [Tremellales sp. Uapishka_1]
MWSLPDNGPKAGTHGVPRPLGGFQVRKKASTPPEEEILPSPKRRRVERTPPPPPPPRERRRSERREERRRVEEEEVYTAAVALWEMGRRPAAVGPAVPTVITSIRPAFIYNQPAPWKKVILPPGWIRMDDKIHLPSPSLSPSSALPSIDVLLVTPGDHQPRVLYPVSPTKPPLVASPTPISPPKSAFIWGP